MGAMSILIAAATRAVLLLIVLGLICLPARLAVQRFMKEGKLKRLLLRPVGDSEGRGVPK
jgi:hypothetical protein